MDVPVATCTATAEIAPLDATWTGTACGIQFASKASSNSSRVSSILKDCCGDTPLLLYDGGCGVYCEDSDYTERNLDNSPLLKCLARHNTNWVCGYQDSITTVMSSSSASSTTPPPTAKPTTASSTPASSTPGAAVGIRDTMSRSGVYIAGLLALNVLLGALLV